MAFQPIENYGVIGNMQSIALVGTNGSIDFLCYPEFDSPTVFAALLEDKNGGRFQIRPQLSNMRVRQLYLPEIKHSAHAISCRGRCCRAHRLHANGGGWRATERDRPGRFGDPRERAF